MSWTVKAIAAAPSGPDATAELRLLPGWTIEIHRRTRPDRVDVYYALDSDWLGLSDELLCEIPADNAYDARRIFDRIVADWPDLLDRVPELAAFVMEKLV